MKVIFKITILVFMTLYFFSCTPDPEPVNQEELITTVIYTLTPKDGGADVIFKFVDIDGDGGGSPTITNGKLQRNQIYTTDLKFLNESVSPMDDITLEIQNEAVDHQVFYTMSNGLSPQLVNFTYLDFDPENNPIGLSTSFKTLDTANGKLTITLRHEPIKKASGVSTGDITNASGETDIEISFDVEIK
jgi:hypothetical protein